MKYEAMYIVRPTTEEAARQALIQEMSGLFSQVSEVKEWGMRDLAYEIDKHKRGYYVVMQSDATPAEVAEFERISRIREDIIRFMIVKIDE
jgi:small subunit ribosomal protein S6